MLILAGLSGSLVVVFPVLVLVFGPNYARIFGTAWAVQVFAVLVLLASYELAIRKIVGRRLEQGKTLAQWFLFLNAFVETSVPSILVLLGSRQVDPVYPAERRHPSLFRVHRRLDAATRFQAFDVYRMHGGGAVCGPVGSGRPLGLVQVKGRDEPIEIYRLA